MMTSKEQSSDSKTALFFLFNSDLMIDSLAVYFPSETQTHFFSTKVKLAGLHFQTSNRLL